jgi:hypothetical protein
MHKEHGARQTCLFSSGGLADSGEQYPIHRRINMYILISITEGNNFPRVIPTRITHSAGIEQTVRIRARHLIELNRHITPIGRARGIADIEQTVANVRVIGHKLKAHKGFSLGVVVSWGYLIYGTTQG